MFAGSWVLGEANTTCDPYPFTIAQWPESDGVNPDRFPAHSRSSPAHVRAPNGDAGNRARAQLTCICNHDSERLHGKLQSTPIGSTYVDPEQLERQHSQFDKFAMKVLYWNDAQG